MRRLRPSWVRFYANAKEFPKTTRKRRNGSRGSGERRAKRTDRPGHDVLNRPGVAKDENEAVRWIRQGAEGGFAPGETSWEFYISQARESLRTT